MGGQGSDGGGVMPDACQSPLVVLSLGWGVQSWALAAMSALGELPKLDYAVHADTTHEAAGTYAHAAKWTPWLEEHGVRVVTVKADRPDVVREDWSDSVLIPAFSTDLQTGSHGMVRRQCTHDWKIMPIRRFLRSVIRPTVGAVESWAGISLDEWERMRSSDVAYIVNVYPLVNKRITRLGCISWLEAHALDVPPKSACTFCPYHSPTQWRALKREGGVDWQRALEVDRAIRDKRRGRVKDKSIQLFVHPARKPLAEAVDIPEDVGASQAGFWEQRPCDGGNCFV